MKYLIFSDCHWSSYTSILRTRGDKFSVRLEYLIKSINWVNQTALELGCNAMICAGDFMDKAQCTDEELTALRSLHWNNLPCYFICGNHESSVSDLRFSSIKAVESESRTIIDKITLLQNDSACNLIMLPYITETDRQPLQAYLERLQLNSTKPNIIISHNDIAGINYAGFESKEGFSIEEINDNCILYLNGHLHNSEFINNKILNIGSLSAHNFTNDSMRYNYGIWLLDTETRKLEFIANPHSLQFYKLDINTEKDLELFSKIKPNAVLSIKYPLNLQEILDKQLKKYQDLILSYRVILNNTSQTSFVDITDVPLISSDYTEKFALFCRTNIQANPEILNSELAELFK